jgi:hypothetical protein
MKKAKKMPPGTYEVKISSIKKKLNGLEIKFTIFPECKKKFKYVIPKEKKRSKTWVHTNK